MKFVCAMLFAAVNLYFLFKVAKTAINSLPDREFYPDWRDYAIIIAFSLLPLVEDGTVVAAIFAAIICGVGIYFMAKNYFFSSLFYEFPPYSWALAIIVAALTLTALNFYNFKGTVVFVPIIAVCIFIACAYATVRALKDCRLKGEGDDDEESGKKKKRRHLSDKGYFILIVASSVIIGIILITSSAYKAKYGTL